MQYLASLPPGMAPATNRSAVHLTLHNDGMLQGFGQQLTAQTVGIEHDRLGCCRPAPVTDGTAGAADDGEELSEGERRQRMAFASGWTTDFAERRGLQIAYNSVFIC
jgi:hypothetical protein